VQKTYFVDGTPFLGGRAKNRQDFFLIFFKRDLNHSCRDKSDDRNDDEKSSTTERLTNSSAQIGSCDHTFNELSKNLFGLVA
jgi:hypothetical protein